MLGKGRSLTITLVLTLCVLITAASVVVSQDAQRRRLALVIGNGAYKTSPLLNTLNDARSMHHLLIEANFSVTTVVDVNGLEMEREINKFVKTLQPGDVALVYYSGHGAQIDGISYLMPTDYTAPDDVLFKHRSYPLNRLLRQMEKAETWLNIVIIDACRVNTYKGGPSGSQGISIPGTGRGTVIIFATAPDMVSADAELWSDENGLFTKYLLQEIWVPGIPMMEVFRRAANATYEGSNGDQQPWIISNMVAGDFYFFPETREQKGMPAAGGANTGTVRVTSNVAGAEVIIDGRTVAVFQKPGTITIPGVPVGGHRFAVIKKDYKTDTRYKIEEVRKGGITTINAYLTPKITADTVLEGALEFLGGREAIMSVSSIIQKGKAFLPQENLESDLIIAWKRPNKIRMELKVGDFLLVRWSDGRDVWQTTRDQAGKLQIVRLAGKEAGEILKMGNHISMEDPFIDPLSKGMITEYKGITELDKLQCYHIIVNYRDGSATHYFFDTRDYRPIMDLQLSTAESGLVFDRGFYLDFKPVQGVRRPHRYIQLDKEGKKTFEMRLDEMQINPPIADHYFAAPDIKDQ